LIDRNTTQTFHETNYWYVYEIPIVFTRKKKTYFLRKFHWAYD